MINILSSIKICQGFSGIARRRTFRVSFVRLSSTYVTPQQQGVAKHGSYEGAGKTTVNILNKEIEGINMIDSYSVDGFRLNDNTKILGPCVIFPTAVLGWRVGSAKDITEESLSLFTLLDPRLDILIIGHGLDKSKRDPIDPKTILKMKTKRLSIEVLPTHQAISTYNFLVEEGRVVAAALIPPDSLSYNPTDLEDTNERSKSLVSTKDNNMFGKRRDEYSKYF